ncbi:MAG: MerR family transcriptional regulator [Thermaerobacter sp.]|nr:MerR family transcriptional regulator [Thermaerobacter sp.]
MVNQAELLQIGGVAEQCRTTTRTLRYYEKMGLIVSTRKRGGFRMYAPETIERVHRIRNMQDLLGWSLDEIRDLLAIEDEVGRLREAYHQQPLPRDRLAILRQAELLTQSQLDLVEQRLQGLRDMQQLLEAKLRRYQAVQSDLLQQLGTRAASGDES